MGFNMADVTTHSLLVEHVNGVTLSRETGELVIFASQNDEKNLTPIPIEIRLSESATTSLLQTLQALRF